MYNLHGIGKRIAGFRKKLGLTQEELASKLDITSQAVSKWENEISFPDIGLLPNLARELNTTIDELFGGEHSASLTDTKIEILSESVHEARNMSSIQFQGGVLYYSGKEIKETHKDKVYFTDGSNADLRGFLINNKGQGELFFKFADLSFEFGSDQTEFKMQYENISTLEIEVPNAEFSLSRSPDENTYVKISGAASFVNGLNIIEKESEGLYIKPLAQHIDMSDNNRIEIDLGCDFGKRIQLSLNGTGDGEITVPFLEGIFLVNGTADLSVDSVDNFTATINGCGDIFCSKAGNPTININGAGDVVVEEVSGTFRAKITGAGDITLKKGHFISCDISILGAGDIDAKGVSTRVANINIYGPGEVILGRVVEESTEKYHAESSIHVLKRGRAQEN